MDVTAVDATVVGVIAGGATVAIAVNATSRDAARVVSSDAFTNRVQTGQTYISSRRLLLAL